MFDFMFRRTRELEEKLREKEEQLEECKAVLREANSLQEYEKEYFVKVTEERSDLAKGLAKIATESRKGKDAAVSASEKAEAFEITFSEYTKDSEKLHGAVKHVKELEAAGERSREADHTRERMEADLAKLRQVFLDAGTYKDILQEFFRNMNVMALSAAIEGQKAGAHAERFVGAAEEIRTKSEENGKVLVRLFTCLENGGKLAEELVKSMENRPRSDKDREALEKAIIDLPDVEAMEQVNRIKNMKKDLSTLREEQEKSISSSTEALSEMDALGTRFLEEQKSAEEAEVYFRRVLGEEEKQ